MIVRTGNKFHAKKIEIDGIKFDSQKEAARWQELKLLEKAGEICELERQPRFLLIPKHRKVSGGGYENPVYYIADFSYWNCCHGIKTTQTVEDVKGLRKGTAYQVFVIKRKLMLERYGIEVKEI
ncbi:MAG: DUF1064 domain-containing protein [Treponemataceae bacterium]|nr:DUF1064 domain-containing protein [Treponemataceae bacterium]